MNEPRDPLLDAIHEAGEVPPPPDRDAAFARAMQSVLMPSRRRLSRGFIALFAAALIGAPAAVFAAHVTHEHPAITTPIVAEIPDPGSTVIQRETDDATVRRGDDPAHEAEHQGTTPSSDDHSGSSSTTTDDHSASGSSTSGSGDSSGSSSGGSDDGATASPTPTPSSTESSGSSSGTDGSSSGGTISGSSESGTPTPSPSGTSGTH